jgi:hypothetical protein
MIRDKFFPEELRDIWYNQETRYMDECWRQILHYHEQQLQQEIKDRILRSTSLYWYKDLVNFNIPVDSYLKQNLPINNLRPFCQVRLLNRHN